MLTPAFHFRILEDFMHTFNKEAYTLVKVLNRECTKGEYLNISEYVSRCALDIICGNYEVVNCMGCSICMKINDLIFSLYMIDTAMGQTINAQEDTDNPYIKAIYEFVNCTSIIIAITELQLRLYSS